MASLKPILPLWRQLEPVRRHEIRLRPTVPAELSSTAQELMLEHLVDAATIGQMPSLAARRFA